MACKTVDARIRVGSKIHTLTEVCTVTRVLKHAYKVVGEDGNERGDIWSYEVFVDAAGLFCADIA